MVRNYCLRCFSSNSLSHLFVIRIIKRLVIDTIKNWILEKKLGTMCPCSYWGWGGVGSRRCPRSSWLRALCLTLDFCILMNLLSHHNLVFQINFPPRKQYSQFQPLHCFLILSLNEFSPRMWYVFEKLLVQACKRARELNISWCLF